MIVFDKNDSAFDRDSKRVIIGLIYFVGLITFSIAIGCYFSAPAVGWASAGVGTMAYALLAFALRDRPLY